MFGCKGRLEDLEKRIETIEFDVGFEKYGLTTRTHINNLKSDLKHQRGLIGKLERKIDQLLELLDIEEILPGSIPRLVKKQKKK